MLSTRWLNTKMKSYILYEKKNSLQTLIYISNNMNCEDSLKPHLDEMLEKVDEALEKTNE